MALYEVPQTLVRLGRFDSSFVEAIRRSREPLSRVLFDLGETINYVRFRLYNRPYFLMVSQNIGRLSFSLGYNTVLTVTSYSDERNVNVADRFESDTGIRLIQSTPESLEDYCIQMRNLFRIFESDPQRAMKILRTGSFVREENAPAEI